MKINVTTIQNIEELIQLSFIQYILNYELMDLLKDPGNTRVFKGLPLPPQRPLKTELLYQKGVIQVNLLKDFLKKEGRIALEDYKRIIHEAIHVFSNCSATQNHSQIWLPSMTQSQLWGISTDNFMIS